MHTRSRPPPHPKPHHHVTAARPPNQREAGTAAYSTLASNRQAQCNGRSVECYKSICQRAQQSCDRAAGQNLLLVQCPDSLRDTYSECYATRDATYLCLGRPRPTASTNVDAYCADDSVAPTGRPVQDAPSRPAQQAAPAAQQSAIPAPAPAAAPAPAPKPAPSGPVGPNGVTLVDDVADSVPAQQSAPAPAPTPRPAPTAPVRTQQQQQQQQSDAAGAAAAAAILGAGAALLLGH
jgi:hypothetical protein